MPMPPKDLTNQRFGKLVAVKRDGQDEGKMYFWLCTCDCGNYARVKLSNLTQGNTKSCGCAQYETKFGYKMTEHPLFHTWHGMHARCTNENHEKYPDYGGRGIIVCARWRNFDLFVTDIGPKPTPLHTLDRIDVNGFYEPDNVRWATPEVQQKNKRNLCVS